MARICSAVKVEVGGTSIPVWVGRRSGKAKGFEVALGLLEQADEVAGVVSAGQVGADFLEACLELFLAALAARLEHAQHGLGGGEQVEDVLRLPGGKLARRAAISPAAASQQATTLRNAGLITSHRHANTVLHTITALGTALRNGDAGRPPAG